MSSVKSVLVPDQVLGSDCDDHPRKTKTGIQDCVSANKITDVVLLSGIMGVSPMKINVFIMVNQK